MFSLYLCFTQYPICLSFTYCFLMMWQAWIIWWGRKYRGGWRCESDLRMCVVQAISFTLYSRGTAYMAALGSVVAINILWLDVPLYIFNKPITNMCTVVPQLKLKAVTYAVTHLTLQFKNHILWLQTVWLENLFLRFLKVTPFPDLACGLDCLWDKICFYLSHT